MLHLLTLPIVVSALASEVERLPISKGDNLSTISETVFGDKHYWPKIWRNQEKMVSPGNSIQFLLGDEEAPPAFAVSESDDETFLSKTPPALAVRPVAAAAAKKASGDFEIPPPKIRPKPILELSGIFPAWQQVQAKKTTFSSYEVEVIPRRVNPRVDREFIPVYVQDSGLRPVGEYIQTVTDSGLVYEGEEVLLRFDRGAGQVGATYLLLQDHGTMQDGWDASSIGGHHSGHVIEVLAEFVVLSQEPGSDKNYRGRITHAIGSSARGASIVPGQVTWIDTAQTGSFASIQAEIIGGNLDTRGMVFGQGDWVFLDRGSKDGLAEGQLLWVNSAPKNYISDTPFEIGTRNSSLIKIAKVSSEISTGLVLFSKQGLMQRDFSGGPTARLDSDDPTSKARTPIDNSDFNTDDPGIGIDTGTDNGDAELKELENSTSEGL
jgi:hypothetical protein